MGIGPLCSIVKYEIHFLASILKLSYIAFVGHTFKQSLHVPHVWVEGLSSSKSIGIKMNAVYKLILNKGPKPKNLILN